MMRNWRRAGIEPPLREVMADPIVHAVMRCDGLSRDDVWSIIEAARGRPRHERTSRGPTPKGNEAPEDTADDSLCRVSSLCDGILPLAGTVSALFALLAILVF